MKKQHGGVREGAGRPGTWGFPSADLRVKKLPYQVINAIDVVRVKYQGDELVSMILSLVNKPKPEPKKVTKPRAKRSAAEKAQMRWDKAVKGSALEGVTHLWSTALDCTSDDWFVYWKSYPIDKVTDKRVYMKAAFRGFINRSALFDSDSKYHVKSKYQIEPSYDSTTIRNMLGCYKDNKPWVEVDGQWRLYFSPENLAKLKEAEVRFCEGMDKANEEFRRVTAGLFSKFKVQLTAEEKKERIAQLKLVIQRNHPDKGGDVDLFHMANDELKSLRGK